MDVDGCVTVERLFGRSSKSSVMEDKKCATCKVDMPVCDEHSKYFFCLTQEHGADDCIV